MEEKKPAIPVESTNFSRLSPTKSALEVSNMDV